MTKIAFVPHTVLNAYLNLNASRTLGRLKKLTGASEAEHICGEMCYVVLTDPKWSIGKIKNDLSNHPFGTRSVWVE